MKSWVQCLSILLIAMTSLMNLGRAEASCQGGGCRNYSDGIVKGEVVYNAGRNSMMATVIAIQPNGKFVLRFADGQVGGGWDRSDLAVMRGCVSNVCVGDIVYDSGRNSMLATVVGIQVNGKLTLKFADGQVGSGWDVSDLAVRAGCSGQVCVGDIVYDAGRNSMMAKVVGLQSDGKLTLSFVDGQVGSGWDTSDLAATKGCSNGLCVGQSVIDVARNSMQATIVGIQPNGKFTLKFADGQVGAGWDYSDLACL